MLFRRRARVLFGLSVLFLIGSAASAHDLWLVPDVTVTAGKSSIVRANSGTKFPKSDHAPDPAVFVKRVLLAPDGSIGKLEAAGKEDTSGLLRFEPKEAGVYIVAVETQPKVLLLDADAFNAYLVSDGLPHIYHQRAQEKTLNQPSRERYRKSPKALLRVGAGGKGDPCRVVGLPLEIVPLHDPFTLREGSTLKVRVLFQGKPLADANLGWDDPGDGQQPRGTVRTDRNGEAYVPIAQRGLMTIRLTHMTQPKVEEFEWESFWTTLTFRIPQD